MNDKLKLITIKAGKEIVKKYKKLAIENDTTLQDEINKALLESLQKKFICEKKP